MSNGNVNVSNDNYWWWVILIVLFLNFDENQYDLYDLIYKYLLKLIG